MAKCRVCGQEIQGSFDAHLAEAHGGDPKVGLDGQKEPGTAVLKRSLKRLFSFGSKSGGQPSSDTGG